MCAKTVAYAFNFALPLVLVRRLNQHEYGLYKQVFLIVGTAVITLPVGFGMSAYYFLPREEARGRVVLNILLFYLRIAATLALEPPIWQSDYFDRYLRSSESYSDKWQYVEQNPVRAGLVGHVEDWPYHGTINDLMF